MTGLAEYSGGRGDLPSRFARPSLTPNSPLQVGGNSVYTLSYQTTYEYAPLDPKVDSIRLLVLAPSINHQSDIRGHLRQAKFGDRPKYEALSYTWGDSLKTHMIWIDENSFYVGTNLMAALQYLRHDEEERTLWIDAICINQVDIPERNRQLSIMPYIYERAKLVTVWLGWEEGLFDFPVNEPPLRSGLRRAARGATAQADHNAEIEKNGLVRPLLEGLCRHPYWERLWIIQELGKARKLQIQHNKTTIEWDHFFEELDKNGISGTRPQLLNQYLQGKYTEAHKLHTLIETHQSALCKEPRDKVYGFVGIAIDTHDGFPMDYAKPLYEVWKDTIMFRAANDNAVNNVLRFGDLVRRVLGGPAIAKNREIEADVASRVDPLPLNEDGYKKSLKRSDMGIHVPARMMGRINYLGPTYDEVIADLSKTSHWRASLNRYLPEHQRSAGSQESDRFLSLLEELENEDLERIYAFGSYIAWENDIELPSYSGNREGRPTSVTLSEGQAAEWAPKLSKAVPEARLSANSEKAGLLLAEPRLFILEGAMVIDDSQPKMGLVNGAARLGDLVCQIDGTDQAVVVREMMGSNTAVGSNGIEYAAQGKGRHRYQIVGTAAVASSRKPQNEAYLSDKERADQDRRFYKGSFEHISTDMLFPMYIDVGIAYQLMG